MLLTSTEACSSRTGEGDLGKGGSRPISETGARMGGTEELESLRGGGGVASGIYTTHSSDTLCDPVPFSLLHLLPLDSPFRRSTTARKRSARSNISQATLGDGWPGICWMFHKLSAYSRIARSELSLLMLVVVRIDFLIHGSLPSTPRRP